MKKTFLYKKHCLMGAKMSPFGGYLMPIQYDGIIKEHNSARNHAALFDTCHMGEFLISGPGAVRDLEKLVSCQVNTIQIGQCRYGLICNEQGGVIDDQILYRLGDEEFMMVVNAATEPADFQWLLKNISPETTARNISEFTAKLDLQGPSSPRIFQSFIKEILSDLKYYHFKHIVYRGNKILTSRTGYTGEIGFEIYCSPELALTFWDDCIKAGVQAAGLGCRDTLRLEMGYPLYGHELNDHTNASMSGFTRAISQKEFIGSSVVLDKTIPTHTLVGIVLQSRRSSRSGDLIFDNNGLEAGRVTSGSFSPSLECALALGYLRKELSSPGTPIKIKTERGELPGMVSDLPFYKKATCREDIKKFL